MKLTFLGTGTSTGVPQMRCDCRVCTSADSHDKRLRCSALLQPYDDAPAILIDCGPDFRRQMLRTGCPDLACALITHTHYDHVGGLDDLRPYAHHCPGAHFPVYCRHDVAADLRARIPYCFAEHPYPGVPQFDLRIVGEGDAFDISLGRGHAPIRVEALAVKHGCLPILGFRIGDFAYITDASELPAATMERLRGLDTLVINALRTEPHPSHQNLTQALNVIKETAPRRAYLTHMSHDMGLHADVCEALPAGVTLAYDGMTVDL